VKFYKVIQCCCRCLPTRRRCIPSSTPLLCSPQNHLATEPAFIMEGPALISVFGDPVLEAMLFQARPATALFSNVNLHLHTLHTV
jgi:hypothetical protein